MNSYNLLAYLIYCIITFFITVRVGWICYKNGLHFLEEELKDKLIAESVNKLLLTGYYLFNLGYASIMIYTWNAIHSFSELISGISSKSAYIVLSLGVMHYINMFLIYFLRKKNKHTIHHQ